MPKIAPWLLLIGLATLGCGPANVDDAEAQVLAALERGDRVAAIEVLEGFTAPDAAGTVRVASLWATVGEATRALWLLEDAARAHPEDAAIHVALARVSLLLANPARALEAASVVPADSEQHVDAILLRAQAQLALGRLEDALALYDEAQRLYPDRPESRLMRITTLQREAKWDEALAAIGEAREDIATLEDEAAALASSRWLDQNEAQVLARQGKEDEAIAALRRQVERDPDAIGSWQLLVPLLVKKERREEAEALVFAALEGDPPRLALYPLAATLHESAGRRQEADRLLAAVLDEAKDASAHLAVARLEMGREDYDAALATLRTASQRFPDATDPHTERFELLLALERTDEARAERDLLSEGLSDQDPRHDYLEARLLLADGQAEAALALFETLVPRLDRAATQYWFGAALEATGDLPGARRRYSLATHRDRNWTAPFAAQLQLARARGDWRDAVSQGRSLARLAPTEAAGWLAMAEAAAELGEAELAEETARRAVALAPDDWQGHVALARALREGGKVEEALASLDAAADAPDAAVPLAAERALILGRTGRLDEALLAVDEALAVHPEVAELHDVRGTLLYVMARADEGDRAIARAIELAPDQPRAYWNRCRYRASTARHAEARSDCERAAALMPGNPEAQFVLGVVLAGLGERDAAIAAYRSAAALDLRDARPRNNLAALLRETGDLEGALEAAQEAYRLEETNPHVLDTLGVLYLEQGLASRAVALLEKAHGGLAGDAKVELNLARAYLAAERPEEARTHLAALREREDLEAPVRAAVEEAHAALP